LTRAGSWVKIAVGIGMHRRAGACSQHRSGEHGLTGRRGPSVTTGRKGTTVPPLRISSPTAEAALALAETLAALGATATPDPDGHWEVTVPLLGAGRGAIPQALAATREWLDGLGLGAASVTLDGHTHLLRASPVRATS
jgi:hypothetical protein